MVTRTDSKAIVRFYEKCADHKPSRVRWLTLTDYISGTGIKVSFEHIDGKENILADELSRLINAILIRQFQHPALDSLIKATLEVSDKSHPDVITRLSKCISKTLSTKGHMVNFFEEVSQPKLQCACHQDAELLTSYTSRNPGRRFYKCSTNTCHIWIWEDLILDYFQRLRNFPSSQNERPSTDTTNHDEDLLEHQVRRINVRHAEFHDENFNQDVDDPSPSSALWHSHYD